MNSFLRRGHKLIFGWLRAQRTVNLGQSGRSALDEGGVSEKLDNVSLRASCCRRFVQRYTQGTMSAVSVLSAKICREPAPELSDRRENTGVREGGVF